MSAYGCIENLKDNLLRRTSFRTINAVRGGDNVKIPLHPMTSEYVHTKHLELVKRMIKDKKLGTHHEMSVELHKANDLSEFNAILDRYDYEEVRL